MPGCHVFALLQAAAYKAAVVQYVKQYRQHAPLSRSGLLVRGVPNASHAGSVDDEGRQGGGAMRTQHQQPAKAHQLFLAQGARKQHIGNTVLFLGCAICTAVIQLYIAGVFFTVIAVVVGHPWFWQQV
jgi:hypothetical protein